MNDWKTVFESSKFRVERCALDLRGVPHVYDVIVHPGAAVILPLLPDGRIVMIHNQRIAVRQELLELPAGTLDHQEPPLQCAERELAEETGYRAGRMDPLVSFYSSPGIMNERMHAFVASELVPGATAHEAGEQIRVRSIPLDEALAAVGHGRIVDAKSIVTLLYYDRFIRSGRADA